MKRTLGVPLLESFDSASPDTPIAQRSITTVAPQALILLNSDFLQQQAAAMAKRVEAATGGDTGAQVSAAYLCGLGREPTEREKDVALAFLQRWNGKDRQAVNELCKLVLNLNEFVYID